MGGIWVSYGCESGPSRGQEALCLRHCGGRNHRLSDRNLRRDPLAWESVANDPGGSQLLRVTTDTNSGTHLEFWMDLIASSAVNLPMSSASLRLVVMRIGVLSSCCTYSGRRTAPRSTLARNLMISMVPFLPFGADNDLELTDDHEKQAIS